MTFFWISALYAGVSQGYDEVYKSWFTPANELQYKALRYVKIDVCHKSLVGDGEWQVSRGTLWKGLCVNR